MKISCTNIDICLQKAKEIIFNNLCAYLPNGKWNQHKICFAYKRSNVLLVEENITIIPPTSITEIEKYLKVLIKFGYIKNYEKRCCEFFIVTVVSNPHQPSPSFQSTDSSELQSYKRAA